MKYLRKLNKNKMLKQRVVFVCIGIFIVCALALMVTGKIKEAFAIIAVSSLSIASLKRREKTSAQLDTLQDTLTNEIQKNNDTLEELNLLSSGVEDAEAHYLEDIKKLTPEEKIALATKLANK